MLGLNEQTYIGGPCHGFTTETVHSLFEWTVDCVPPAYHQYNKSIFVADWALSYRMFFPDY